MCRYFNEHLRNHVLLFYNMSVLYSLVSVSIVLNLALRVFHKCSQLSYSIFLDCKYYLALESITSCCSEFSSGGIPIFLTVQ
jgi:hypothetical protein